MATKQSDQQLSTLIINKVDSIDTFNEMIEDEQVNSNELYLVEGDGDDLGLSVVNGILCMTFGGDEFDTIISNGTVSVWQGGTY